MTETLATKKPLTGYHLKLIALVTMFIDHIGAVFFPQVWFLRAVGRISFPIYVFLAAEGCRYTHDRFKYALRLGAFALISEIPYDLALYPKILEQTGWGWNFVSRTNVFYTLFFAVASIYLFESLRRQFRSGQMAAVGYAVVAYPACFYVLNFMVGGGLMTWGEAWPVMNVLYLLYTPVLMLICRRNEKKYPDVEWANRGMLSNVLAILPVLWVLLTLADNLTSSYGVFGVVSVFLVYLAKDRAWQSILLALLMGYYYGRTPLQAILGGSTTIPIPYGLARLAFALGAAALVWFAYNGERGKKAKWGFYAAYPAHLAILAAIRAVLKV